MKRFLSALLAFVMILATGCSTSSPSSISNPDSSKPAAQSSEAAQPADQGTPENPIVLTMVAKDMPKTDPVVVQYLENVEKGLAQEGKYVKIELLEIQEGTYADSVSLLLQSGTIPDIIYFQGGDYQFGVTQGILEDLTPYVANSKYVKDVLEPHSVECLKNYPYLLWIAPTRTKVPVVRKDWFEQTTVGKELLENPTPENYYKFFKELREKFTSKAVFTVQGASDGLTEVNMLFGQAFGEGKSWVKDSDNKYTYSKITKSELEKLEFYAKLYRESLLDNEYLTKKYEAKEKAMYSGEVGVIMATQGQVATNYNGKSIKQNGEAGELMVLPPAKGESVWSFTPIDVSKESRGWAIGKTSEHKQLAFDVMDFLAGSQGQIVDKLGFEGTHYTVKDGKYELTAEFSSWYPRFHESVAHFNPPMAESTPYLSEIAKASYKMVQEHSTNDNAFLIPDDLVTDWDAATSIYNEFAADMISGKKTAADWDAFVENWKAMGGQAVIDYANTIL